MKKTLRTITAILAAALMLICIMPAAKTQADLEIWDGSIATAFAGGSGTENDPYLISNGAELAFLAMQVNGGNNYENNYFNLTADICLNNTAGWENWETNPPANEWTPIRTMTESWSWLDDSGFPGIFDGKNFVISGVYINSDSDYQGLFGLNNGTIMNLGVEASYINGNDFIGGIAGRCDGSKITDCYFSGKVHGNNYIGGILGFQKGASLVKNCYSTGNISGNNCIGGVAGELYNGTLTNCHNTANINGNENVGGVVGIELGDVTDCYNTGNVSGTINVGGVGGDASLSNSYNTGSISGTDKVGGVAGRSIGMDHCWNKGVVNADGNCAGGIAGVGNASGCRNSGAVCGNDFVGGICGSLWDGYSIENCSNTGNISGRNKIGGIVGTGNRGYCKTNYNTGTVSGNDCVGGIIGSGGSVTNNYNTGKIKGNEKVGGISGIGSAENCYNIGNVSGTASIAPIIGDGDVKNCYYLENCCPGGSAIGNALTDAQMRVADSFKNFDFDTIWTMEGDPNYAYPELIGALKAGNADPAPVQTTEPNVPFVPGNATSAPQSSTETVPPTPGATAKPGGTHKSGISPLLIIVIILAVIAVVTLIILLTRKRSKAPKTNPPQPEKESQQVAPTPIAAAPYQPSIPPAKLIGIAGMYNDAVIDISDGTPINFGRDPHTCQIVFDDSETTISRTHCTVTYMKLSNNYFIRDTSKNGVYIGNMTNRIPSGCRQTVPRGTVIYLGSDKNAFRLN